MNYGLQVKPKRPTDFLLGSSGLDETELNPTGASAFTLSMSAANKITVTNDANNGYVTISFAGSKPY